LTVPATKTKSIGLPANAHAPMVFATQLRKLNRDKIIPAYLDGKAKTIYASTLAATKLYRRALGLIRNDWKLRSPRQNRNLKLSEFRKHFMKYYLIALFIFLNIPIKSQILNLGDPGFKGNISRVIEKSVRYPKSWREFSFDNKSKIIEDQSFRDDKLVEDVKWNYLDLDSVVIAKEKNGDKVSTHKSYFDSSKRLIKYELFSPDDSIFPSIVENNVKYFNGLIQQFNRFLLNRKDTIFNEFYRYEYSQDKTSLKINENDKKNHSTETITLKFDKKGNQISKVIDYNDPSIVVTGVRPWTKSKRDKYRIDCKYDKFGNWIKSYAVTKFCKYKICTREIQYR